MKAYIDMKSNKLGHMAKVISWQDYHEGGPFAYSYVCGLYASEQEAFLDASGWARANGYQLCSADEVANEPEQRYEERLRLMEGGL